MKSKFNVIILSIILCLCLVLPVLVTAEVPSTVYFLPKDNVDIVKNPNRNYLITKEDAPFDEAFFEELLPDLVFIPNYVDGDTMAVEKATYLAFTRLQYKLRTEYNIEIQLYDGFRTIEDHQWLIDSGIATLQTGAPGYTEHHTGLMLNVVVRVGDYFYNEEAISREDIPEEVKNSENFAIVRSVMADYGFINRYPEGKQEITGLPFTPSEFRFVGSSEVAHAIMDNGLCLEEYLSTLNE